MHSHHNGLKTALLMGSMLGFLAIVGALIAGMTGKSFFIWLFALFGVATVAYTYWNSDKLAIRSMNAYPVTAQEVPGLYRIVEELSQRAGQPMPRLYVAPTLTPNAFATGRNPQHAAVCCTEGILQLLDERQMRAVLGHELMHVYNRDILIGSIAAAIASIITSLAQYLSFAGIFGGNRNNGAGNILGTVLLAFLAPLAASLVQMAISRTREFDADQDGAELTQDPLALASALAALDAGIDSRPLVTEDQRVASTASMMIANPFGRLKLDRVNLFATHPPMQERIARLKKQAERLGQL